MKKAPTIQVKKTKSPSQTEQILAALERGEKLTPLDALNRFACMRLGARVFELKEPPYNIPVQDETIELPSGKHVKRYYLEPDYLEARRAHEACHESQELPDADNEGGLAR